MASLPVFSIILCMTDVIARVSKVVNSPFGSTLCPVSHLTSPLFSMKDNSLSIILVDITGSYLKLPVN
jgi:hypothetical protein